MAVSYVKDENWLTRNMGYDLTIDQLGQRARYLGNPKGFLDSQKNTLIHVKKEVGAKFKDVYDKLVNKGVPDAAARQLAINAAQQVGQLESVMMGLKFPEQLFGDAARSTYGDYEMKYPDTDAASAIVGTPPPIGYVKKYKKKSKKSKKN